MTLLPSIQDAPSAKTNLSMQIDPSADFGAEPDHSGVWNSTDGVNAFRTDFYEVLVVIGQRLSAEELSRLSGCIGYGLRAVLCGEELSIPDVSYWQDEHGRVITIAQYAYDSTKSIRTEPDFAAAFALACRYAAEGTPIRRTNRAGHGTRGTRLVCGIGNDPITFYVR